MRSATTDSSVRPALSVVAVVSSCAFPTPSHSLSNAFSPESPRYVLSAESSLSAPVCDNERPKDGEPVTKAFVEPS